VTAIRIVTEIPAVEGTSQLKLKTAAYVRVSTDQDEQLLSFEAQLKHYEMVIKANSELEFAGIYSDEGISATGMVKRSGLLRLIADCEAGKVDFIITKSISRLARNTVDCLEVVRKLTELGTALYFEKEQINTGSMESELMLSILSSLAESESISTSENVSWSIQNQFKKGTFRPRYAPYGYDIIDGQFVPNFEQAKVVKRIFTEALAGLGTEKIAGKLNNDQIPTKRNSRWIGSTISGILKNEKYVGDVLLQKTYTDDSFKRHYNRGEKNQYYITDNHEAIISREDFEAVQLELERRRKAKGIKVGGSKYQNRYAFSGNITCGECGSTFKRRTHGKGESKYAAWACTKHLKDSSACSMLFIRDESVKLSFVLMLAKLRFGHDVVLKPLLERLKNQNLEGNFAQIDDLERGIKETREKRETVADLYAQKYLEPAIYNKVMNELALETKSLTQKKDALLRSVNAGAEGIKEIELLLKKVASCKDIPQFSEDLFQEYATGITVFEQNRIGFRLKCGLTLTEELYVDKEENLLCEFFLPHINQIHRDPFQQAEHAYNLIGRKGEADVKC
jgi:site-specific DNA recombinase